MVKVERTGNGVARGVVVVVGRYSWEVANMEEELGSDIVFTGEMSK